jgi:hypothetical protein
MLQNYKIGETKHREDEIFYNMLSQEAQQIALSQAGVKHSHEANWDVFPISYIEGSVQFMDQKEIDDIALAHLGCYNLVA